MAATASGSLPARGPARVAAELKRLQRAVAKNEFPPVRALELDGDDLGVWRLTLSDFDEDSRGGRQLNSDVRALAHRHAGHKAEVKVELRFDVDRYPDEPPFVRQEIGPVCAVLRPLGSMRATAALDRHAEALPPPFAAAGCSAQGASRARAERAGPALCRLGPPIAAPMVLR